MKTKRIDWNAALLTALLVISIFLFDALVALLWYLCTLLNQY